MAWAWEWHESIRQRNWNYMLCLWSVIANCCKENPRTKPESWKIQRINLHQAALLSSLFLYNGLVPVRLGNGFKHWHAHVTPKLQGPNLEKNQTYKNNSGTGRNLSIGEQPPFVGCGHGMRWIPQVQTSIMYVHMTCRRVLDNDNGNKHRECEPPRIQHKAAIFQERLHFRLTTFRTWVYSWALPSPKWT